jgi:hypothetical protein
MELKMDDTSKIMANFYCLQFAALSGEKRMRMAADSFDSAKTMVLSSLKAQLTESEIKRQLLLRFYKEDISKKQMDIFLETCL